MRKNTTPKIGMKVRFVSDRYDHDYVRGHVYTITGVTSRVVNVGTPEELKLEPGWFLEEGGWVRPTFWNNFELEKERS